jgi:hypothetical protein
VTKWRSIFREASLASSEAPPERAESTESQLQPVASLRDNPEKSAETSETRAWNVRQLGPRRPDLVEPTGDDPGQWQSWRTALVEWRTRSGYYSREQAKRLAYCEAIEAWSRAHPLPRDGARCDGCGLLHTGAVMLLPDGTRVHWPRSGDMGCLIRYGGRRRRRAADGLRDLGVLPPEGWEQ